MITDTPISVFRNAQSTSPATARLGAFLDSKKYRDRVLAVRAESDKTIRDQRKKELPAATISGVFKHRSVAGCVEYNGLICLDFDAKENPGRSAAEMRAILAEFEEVAYAGLSVSGQGIFAIVPTTCTGPADHAEAVDLLGAVLAQFDIYYDRACKDISRLRFVSYDPDAHWNLQPKPFDAAKLISARRAEELARRPKPLCVRNKQAAPGSSTEKKVQAFIEAIESMRADITTSYEEWMRLGMALANEFGTNGEAYFQRISQFHPDYNPATVAKKYSNFLVSASRVHIGSFFHICNSHNIRVS